jgi:lipopolysaccharide export system permease protein
MMEVYVFGSILHRMILWELVKVFLMSLVGITGILLMAGIVAEASQQGLGPGQILAAIPLLIPSTLPYTIPATTLFAACVVYGRLAADNEILAIKSAGINILTVVKPALLLGLTMSAVTMGLYYRLIPYAHHLLRAMVFNDAEELIYTMLRKQRMVTNADMPYALYVSRVQGRQLLNPLIKRRDAHHQVDGVAEAREAEIRVDRVNRLLLVHMKYGMATTEDGSRAYFVDRVFEVPLPLPKPDAYKRPRDMTWQEMLRARAKLLEEQEQTRTEIALKTAESLMNDAPSDLPQHVKNLKERLDNYRQQVLWIDVELQMRPALSLGCFCFILVGCPVGIWFSRSDYLSSFITCFLPIVFLYYPLMLCGTGIAKEGRLDLVLMVWGADALMGVIGTYLFYRLLRN